MRAIGYRAKGKAESVDNQVAREVELGGYCALRTTAAEKNPQDIARFIYRNLDADLPGFA